MAGHPKHKLRKEKKAIPANNHIPLNPQPNSTSSVEDNAARQKLNATILLEWQEKKVREWTKDNMYQEPLLTPVQEEVIRKWSQENFSIAHDTAAAAKKEAREGAKEAEEEANKANEESDKAKPKEEQAAEDEKTPVIKSGELKKQAIHYARLTLKAAKQGGNGAKAWRDWATENLPKKELKWYRKELCTSAQQKKYLRRERKLKRQAERELKSFEGDDHPTQEKVSDDSARLIAILAIESSQRNHAESRWLKKLLKNSLTTAEMSLFKRLNDSHHSEMKNQKREKKERKLQMRKEAKQQKKKAKTETKKER